MWDLIVDALTGDLVPVLTPNDELDLELLEDYPELLLLGLDV